MEVETYEDGELVLQWGTGGEQIVKCALTWHFGRPGRRGLGDSGTDLGKSLEGQSHFSRTYHILICCPQVQGARALFLSRFNSDVCYVDLFMIEIS